jgi:hypothetical protein
MVPGRNVSKWSETDVVHTNWAVSPLAALGTGGAITDANATIRCNGSQVALIDEIVMNCRTADAAATNNTVFLRVNGRTNGVNEATSTATPVLLPFNFPSDVNLVRNETITLRPRGKLVIHPSSTFAMYASAVGIANAQVRYRLKNLSAAIRDGDISPNGTLPQCAAITGGLVDATAKLMSTVGGTTLAATAGEAIEISAIYCTGHNYNAAADNLRIGFWDAAGTFAANGKTIFRTHFRGANSRFASRLLIDNVDHCIQGPLGMGLYVQCTTQLAGTPPKADYVVIYRKVFTQGVSHPYGETTQTPGTLVAAGIADAGGDTTHMVDSARIEADNWWNGKQIRFTSGANSGQVRLITAFAAASDTVTFSPAVTASVGAADTYDILDAPSRNKWWCCTETVGGGGVGDFQKFFAPAFATTAGTAIIKLKGHAISCNITENASDGILGLGLGNGTVTLSEVYVFNGGDPNSGGGNIMSSTVAHDTMNQTVQLASEPGFAAVHVGAGISTRVQLAWGTFGTSTQSNPTPQAL